ncbi:MAG: response regulator, partial [Planctomycetota bacterium]
MNRRPRVLVVDDEPSVLAFLSVTLERAGYQVEARSSLQDGMATLLERPFDLVLSDLYLGSDLAYRLAELASQRTPRVPVILLTGRPTFTGAAEALKSRVAEIVAKPIDPALLVNTCRRTVRDHVLRTRNEE